MTQRDYAWLRSMGGDDGDYERLAQQLALAAACPANARSVPLVVQYDLSTLKQTGYKPREADDRLGHFHTVHQDFTSDRPSTPYVRYITRWNLEKSDPAAPLSPPSEPIVFWLENTIPVEYRESIKEGTLLWNKAFERVGFKDAVVVKQQPDSADWDAADTRYNTIRWFAGVDVNEQFDEGVLVVRELLEDACQSCAARTAKLTGQQRVVHHEQRLRDGAGDILWQS